MVKITEYSGFVLTFQERIYLTYFKLKKKISKIHSFGKTKITLMLIPHDQESIVKLDISLYLMLFVSLVSTMLVFISFSYVYFSYFGKYNNIKIYEEGNNQKILFLHYDLMAEELEEEVKDMISITEDLNLVTWEKKEFDSINELAFPIDHSLELKTSSSNDELESNMKIFLSTVNRFTEINQKLNHLKYNFQNAMDYLETRESIYQSLPQGRPLGPGVGMITSTFGYRPDPFYMGKGEFHSGIDFASAEGTFIHATAPSIVSEIRNTQWGLGNMVKLNHENGFYTIYGHCSEILVRQGERVSKGQVIAKVGSTGKATGSHVHYEVHIGLDPPVDPKEFINID